ncbi:MAG: hypothetical protein L0H84_17515 [Pseudonocardia sp.]|nr:hypothetical protein [Pseudonocardia sp.]
MSAPTFETVGPEDFVVIHAQVRERQSTSEIQKLIVGRELIKRARS